MDVPAVRPIDSVLSPQSPVLTGLSLGDVVRARVLEITGDVTRLSVGDQTILAQTRATLTPGDQIRLQVRDLAPDRVELRLVPSDESVAPASPVTARDPGDLLATLGLADSPANRQIAGALLAAGQPVTPAAIDTIARALVRAQAGNASALDVSPDPAQPLDPEDARAAVFLEAHQLPLSPDALALARRFLADVASGVTLADRLQDVGRLLAEVSPHPLPPPPRRGEGPMVGSNAGSAGAGASPSSPLPLEEGPGEGVSSALQSATDALRELASSLPLLTESQATASSADLASTLRNLIETLGTSLEHRLADAAGPASPAGLDHDPRALVAQALALVDRQPAGADLQPLRAALQGLGDHLAGQQLANLGKSTSPLDPGYYLVQIPVAGQPGDAYRTAELRIYRSGDEADTPARARVDPENVRVVFHLSLSQLQTVDVDLNIYQRRVSCRITSADDVTARFIQDRAGDLKDGLFALGYVVDDVRSVASDPASSDGGTRASGGAGMVTPSRILRLDARA